MKFIENIDLYSNNFLFTFRAQRKHPGQFHAHKGMEFIYIYKGTGHIMLDHRMYELRSGTLIIFQPYQLHRIHQDDSAEYIRSYVVFEPSLFESYLASFPSLRSFFYHLWKDQLQNQIFYDIGPDHPLVHLYEELQERKHLVPDHKLTEEYGLFIMRFLCLLRLLWAKHENPDAPSVRSLSQVERMMAWLEEHYNEPFSIDELSKHVHLSPKHISAIFRQKTGGTLTDYLMAIRLNQACLLLKTSSKPVTEIGQEIGFTNTSYFCQFFKKKMAVTPYQYRKQFLELV
ncbi:AraC family transcriptional regulator [Paenibacillus thalictri]|uniref:AraC family transcriptional regulator n=1 Tax=Paenibacillus thalictri TaxID=2527873 RepID=A0A4Q9DZT8_9BACL|nr:AraC family transcriptional regulator [Paenibacillus thalictri]TBL81956.1 AraC family transcriptional regulator [Paenibacillus thalictri]